MQYGAKTSDYQANESLQYQAYNYIVRSHNGSQKRKNASKRCGEMGQFYVELACIRGSRMDRDRLVHMNL